MKVTRRRRGESGPGGIQYGGPGIYAIYIADTWGLEGTSAIATSNMLGINLVYGRAIAPPLSPSLGEHRTQTCSASTPKCLSATLRLALPKKLEITAMSQDQVQEQVNTHSGCPFRFTAHGTRDTLQASPLIFWDFQTPDKILCGAFLSPSVHPESSAGSALVLLTNTLHNLKPESLQILSGKYIACMRWMASDILGKGAWDRQGRECSVSSVRAQHPESSHSGCNRGFRN